MKVAPQDVLAARVLQSNGAYSIGRFLYESPPDDDAQLAAFIDAESTARRSIGAPTTIDDLLRDVPGLRERDVALRAAVLADLRSRSGQMEIREFTVTALKSEHPELADVIDRAIFDDMSASLAASALRPPEDDEIEYPADFGPLMPSGRARYELRMSLGSGSYGRVYRAVDRYLSQPEMGIENEVTIKVLSRVDVRRLGRSVADEASKARMISHAGVARLVDRGVTSDGSHFLVFEYVAGRDLQRDVEVSGFRDEAWAARVMAQVADAVHAAHVAGVLHCDLKPANVIVDQGASRRPRAVVTDFGMAALHLNGGAIDTTPAGNRAYLAPERMATGAPATTGTDVFALGAMLTWLLMREPLRTEPQHVRSWTPRWQWIRDELRQRRVDPDLAAIALKGCHPEPAERFGGANELAAELQRWLQHEPVMCARPSAARRMRLWIQRRPISAVVAAACAMLIVALTAIAGVNYNRAVASVAEARAIADRERELRENSERIGAQMRELMAGFAERVKSDYAGDVLLADWLMDWVQGPDLFGTVAEPVTRSNRIPIYQRLVDDLVATGDDWSIDAVVYRGALGLALVNEGRYREANAAILPAFRVLESSPGNNTRWSNRLVVIQTVSHIGQMLEEEKQTVPDEVHLKLFEAQMVLLEKMIDDLKLRADGGELLHLAYQGLTMGYGPHGLDRPLELERARDEYRDLGLHNPRPLSVVTPAMRSEGVK